jgi:hypothetical protein
MHVVNKVLRVPRKGQPFKSREKNGSDVKYGLLKLNHSACSNIQTPASWGPLLPRRRTNTRSSGLLDLNLQNRKKVKKGKYECDQSMRMQTWTDGAWRRRQRDIWSYTVGRWNNKIAAGTYVQSSRRFPTGKWWSDVTTVYRWSYWYA